MSDILLDIGKKETLLLPERKTLVGGLKIDYLFSKPDIHPYDDVEWEKRDVTIFDYAKGRPSFSRQGVEVPSHWSENSVRITVAKYLFGSSPEDLEYEDSLRHPFDRIANTYTVWGWKNGYFATLEDAKAYNWELKAMLLKQIWAPNSPVWFNIGHWEQYRWGRPDLRSIYQNKGNKAFKAVLENGEVIVREIDNSLTHPQTSACFLTEIEDSMESILFHGISEGRIFSSGSGVGLNMSTLRSSYEPISGRGKSSGPLSFNKGWDRMAGAIKSGGRSRRAARMVLLDSDHPDIFDFVKLKNSQEQIAKIILREHNSHEELKKIANEKLENGTDAEKVAANFILSLPLVNDKKYAGDMDGEIYGETITDQNANHSVSLRGDFWKSYWANGEYSTRWVTNPNKVQETFAAKKLLEEMAKSVYDNAEPGCHNNDYINLWNPVKSKGRINTSNPCVTADSLVATEGLATIESLVGQTPRVINQNGGLSQATAVFPTGIKPVYRLLTKSGFGLNLTADHKVDTANRGDVPACELLQDDVVKLQGSSFGSNSVDPKIAYLAGLALGDGCVCEYENQRSAVWTFGSHERDEATKVAALINSYKAQHPTGDGRADTEVSASETSTGYKVSTSRPDIVQALENLCVLDKGSKGKALTQSALRLNESSLSLLLQGYGDSDGCVANYGDKSQYIALDSCSEHLLEQVQVVLLSFGIKAKLYRNRRADKSGKALLPDGKGGTKLHNVEQMHSLRISRSGRITYEQKIGFSNVSKRAKLEEVNKNFEAYLDQMTDSILSLDYIGDFPVFDLTEPETSHFVANGIVIHNCSEYLHVNNTSCNLSSFNAFRFLKDGKIDVYALRHATRLAMIAADLNIEESGFPIPEIASGTYRYRSTGVGFGNIGGLLMSLGIPYDSDEGRYLSGLLTSELTAASWLASSEIAREVGGYHEYESTKDDLAQVLNLHKACHQMLLNLPHIAAGNAEAEDVIKYITANGGSLPQSEGLTGVDALRALKTSFKLTTPWDGIRTKAAESLTSENPWDLIDTNAIYRNSFTTLYAPGGTISAPLGIYDEGTTSAEPDYSLVKYKSLSGGGSITMFNSLALQGLRSLGYNEFQIREAALEVAGINGLIIACNGSVEKVVKHLATKVEDSETGPVRRKFENSPRPAGETLEELISMLAYGKQTDLPMDVVNGIGNVENIPWLPNHHKEVFDCAATTGGGSRAIAPDGHIRMLGALMPFISGAISKTVNLPHYATVEEILECFELSHKMGVKCIALYRADSKGVSVYQTDSPEAKKWDAHHIWKTLVSTVDTNVASIKKEASKPRRRKLPGTRTGQIMKFDLGGQIDGFIVAGIYPDGRCGEVFGRLGQGGSFAHGMFESFCKAFSVMLQWGVPLPDAIRAFKNTAFDPAGFVRVAEGDSNIDIKSCKSVVDLMMRMLEWLFPEKTGYRLRDYSNEIPPMAGVSIEPIPLDEEEWDMPSATKDKLSSAEMCPECHALAVIQDGKCKRCTACGFSSGGCGG